MAESARPRTINPDVARDAFTPAIFDQQQKEGLAAIDVSNEAESSGGSSSSNSADSSSVDISSNTSNSSDSDSHDSDLRSISDELAAIQLIKSFGVAPDEIATQIYQRSALNHLVGRDTEQIQRQTPSAILHSTKNREESSESSSSDSSSSDSESSSSMSSEPSSQAEQTMQLKDQPNDPPRNFRSKQLPRSESDNSLPSLDDIKQLLARTTGTGTVKEPEQTMQLKDQPSDLRSKQLPQSDSDNALDDIKQQKAHTTGTGAVKEAEQAMQLKDRPNDPTKILRSRQLPQSESDNALPSLEDVKKLLASTTGTGTVKELKQRVQIKDQSNYPPRNFRSKQLPQSESDDALPSLDDIKQLLARTTGTGTVQEPKQTMQLKDQPSDLRSKQLPQSDSDNALDGIKQQLARTTGSTVKEPEQGIQLKDQPNDPTKILRSRQSPQSESDNVLPSLKDVKQLLAQTTGGIVKEPEQAMQLKDQPSDPPKILRGKQLPQSESDDALPSLDDIKQLLARTTGTGTVQEPEQRIQLKDQINDPPKILRSKQSPQSDSDNALPSLEDVKQLLAHTTGSSTVKEAPTQLKKTQAVPELPKARKNTPSDPTPAPTYAAAAHQTKLSEVVGPRRQLDFSTIGLLGRGKELRVLQNAVDGVFRNWERKNEDPIAETAQQENEAQYADKQAPPPARILALLQGDSGTGKSELAMHLKPQCLERFGFFVSGGFRLSSNEVPLSAMRFVLADLCKQILRLPQRNQGLSDSQCLDDPRQFAELQNLLQQGLQQNEVNVLSAIVPKIKVVVVQPTQDEDALAKSKRSHSSSFVADNSNKGILPRGEGNVAEPPPVSKESLIQATASSSRYEKSGSYQNMSNRLKFAFRRFLQIVSNYCPIFMVLDNFQWADQASLDLFESWIIDSQNSSLMVIGCYRTNSVDVGHPLTQKIELIKKCKRERLIRMIQIPVEELELVHVNAMLVSLLFPVDFPKVSGLAAILHKSTGGNVLLLQQLLRALVQDAVLVYDDANIQWTWDEDEVEAKTMVPGGVTDLIVAKICRIRAAQQVLPIAACLGGGATFSNRDVWSVMKGLSRHPVHAPFFSKLFQMPASDITENQVRDTLQDCETAGLIHRRLQRGSNIIKCQFHHSTVQEAALALIPSNEMLELEYCIGEVLLIERSPDESDGRIFSITNLLNSRLDLVPSRGNNEFRLKVVKANYSAGLRAAMCSSFYLASEYFKHAISLLPNQHWESHFRMSADLYMAAAECAYVNADFDKVKLYCSELIGRRCPIMDKIQAYHILIDAGLAQHGNALQIDPIAMSLSALSQLKCRIPQSKLGRMFAVAIGKMALKRRALGEKNVRTMPVCIGDNDKDDSANDNATEIMIMKTLDKLVIAARLTRPSMLSLAVIKSIERTFENGITVYSPPSFAMQGLISGAHDPKASRKLGEAALNMISMLGRPESESRTIRMAHSMCVHWARPLERSKDAYLEGYRKGMSLGDVDEGILNIYNYMRTCFFTGSSLAILDVDMSTFAKIMQDFQQTTPHVWTCMLWQAVLNLQGSSNYRVQLIGDAFDERKQLPKSDPIARLIMTGNHIIIAAYFGEYKAGARLSFETRESRQNAFPADCISVYCTFLGGFCCYIVSGRSKHKKYAPFARQCRKQLKMWQKQGNPNCGHYLSILNAERAICDNKHEQALAHYNEGIAIAGNRGFIHDQALANERLALCWLVHRKDERRARHHFDESIRLYTEWGAMGVVHVLEERIKKILGKQQQHN